MEETFIEVVSTVKVICGVKSLVVLDVTVRVTRLSALAITFVFAQWWLIEAASCPTWANFIK